MSGKVLAMARRKASRAPMETVLAALIDEAGGLEGDLRGEDDERQVTLLTREGWEAASAELDRDLPWTTRRANILIEGVAVAGELDGVVRIGEAELVITGETAPCQRMDELAAGLRQALTPDWRGGVTCRVSRGGRVQAGDAVELAGKAPWRG